VLDGVSISPVSAMVTITGSQTDTQYEVEWWDPYRGHIVRILTVIAGPNGSIPMTVTDLAADVAVKVKIVSNTKNTFIPIVMRG
jgi:hypothetical protein